MEYVNLGRSGLKVSRLCLGTMNFGYVTDKQEAFKIMDEATAQGVNFFDSADVYGGPQKPDMEKGYGISEEIIGDWLEKNKKRNDLVIATKCYQPMNLGPNDRRLSAYHIRKACEDSLRRLKTDHIDLYQMHHIDRFTPWEEIWQAMELLVQEGKVIYVGSSNFAGWHIATAQGIAKSRHFLGLVSEQSLYNLTERSIEQEVIPACRYHGLGILPWSPLAGGLLGGMFRGKLDSRRLALRETAEKLKPQLQKFEALCDDLSKTPAAVALAWLLHNSAVTAPIMGPQTLGQLNEDLEALNIKLSAESLQKLDSIWPGPKGEAPEAYAW